MKRCLLRLGIVARVTVSSVSCATYSLTPMQRRSVTSRVLGGPYEDVYRAALTVLQDRGYQIERTELDTGLLRGQRPEDEAGGGGVGSALLGLAAVAAAIIVDAEPDPGRDDSAEPMLDLTCVISKIDGNHTEVRALLVGRSGNVYEAGFYQQLFSEIAVEVQRRAAISGATPSGRPQGGP